MYLQIYRGPYQKITYKIFYKRKLIKFKNTLNTTVINMVIIITLLNISFKV